jgi:nitrite reductase/ring-hydroxylating ferredoxin subunit
MAPIADAEAVDDGTVVFRVRRRDTGETEEAILVAVEDTIRAWRNYCKHFTHVRIDKGDGAPRRDGELVCTNHGAMFDAESGVCTFGPCEGAMLDPVEVAVEDGVVHLVDEGYEFVGLGPVERDPTDLSSANPEF